MIIDEIDAPMFSNLEFFYKSTKGTNLRVIGLTASPFDGVEEGTECRAISLMQYQVYYYAEGSKQMMKPMVNETYAIKTQEEYRKLIEEKKKTQPVLIYANQPLFASLAEIEGVETVTKDTNKDELNSLDRKKGLYYSVKMISDDYGTRGLNFRASNSNLGICMIIGGSFSCRRHRVQGLMRVGRFNDKCYRI